MTLYRCLNSSIVGGKLVSRGEFLESDAETLGVMAEHFTAATVDQEADPVDVSELTGEPEPDAAGVVAPVRRIRKKDAQ